jgi:hypothetical protein
MSITLYQVIEDEVLRMLEEADGDLPANIRIRLETDEYDLLSKGLHVQGKPVDPLKITRLLLNIAGHHITVIRGEDDEPVVH